MGEDEYIFAENITVYVDPDGDMYCLIPCEMTINPDETDDDIWNRLTEYHK